MAVSAKWYGNGLKAAFNKEVDWDTDTIKVALCTSSYTPDQDAHDYFDDITNELATANGYTAGGATLASKTITYTGATNKLKLDAADTSWANTAFTARYAIIYLSTGTAATSPLLGYVDFGEDKTTKDNGTFLITWAADGILEITAS